MRERILMLTGVELYKLSRQKFAYLLIVFVVMNAMLVGIGSRIFPAIMSAMHGAGGAPAFDGYTFASIIGSGTFGAAGAGTIAMLAFSGSMVASETEGGTLKNILVRPVYRSEFLIAKALALFVYCAAIVAVTAVLGISAGAAMYGLGDISIAETGEVYRTQHEMFMNLGVMYMMDLLSIYAVGCMGLLMSVVINNNGWAVITSLVMYFPVMFLKNFGVFKDWIFTAYMDMGQNILREMVVVKSKTWLPDLYYFAGVNLITIALFVALSVCLFGRKEIH
ncbi:MAG TPA: ABC transporter permease [Nitrospirota bacterium]